MYKIYSSLFIVILCLSIYGCASDNSDIDILTSEYLKITHKIDPNMDNGVKGLLKISSNCGWKVKKPADVIIEESGDGEAELEFLCPAAIKLIRHDTIRVISTSGRLMPYVVISQYPTEEIIDSDKDELIFDNAGETKLLAIIANTSWTLLSKADWVVCSVLQGEDTKAVEITAKPNPTGESRKTSLVIKGKKGTEKIINVYQRDLSQHIDINPESLKAAAIGGTYQLRLSGNLPWQVTIDQQWVNIDKFTGDGDATLNLTIETNYTTSTRQATITIKAFGLTRNCMLTQEAGRAPIIVWSKVELKADKRSVEASAEVESAFDVDDCGFCYSSNNQTPNIQDKKISINNFDANNSFETTISGLENGKTYYFRAYAKNAVGLTYGEVHQVSVKGIPGESDNPLPNPK